MRPDHLLAPLVTVALVAGCDPPDLVETRLVDRAGQPIPCDRLHDLELAPIIRLSGSDHGLELPWLELPCGDGSVELERDFEPWSARITGARGGAVHDLTAPVGLVEEQRDHYVEYQASFTFGPIRVSFSQGGEAVTSYSVDSLVLANGAEPYRGARFAVGEAPLVHAGLAGEHSITVTGYVLIGGVERGCYHGTATAAVDDTVVIPFAPLIADAEACGAPVVECVLQETCGNGLDDDCDGAIEEGCACAAGAVAACFSGSAAERGVGACRDGTMTCGGDGWGACEGELAPEAERCDGLDNDCDGATDEGLACTPTLTCPASETLAEGQPFAPYLLDGGAWIDPAQVESWRWTVEGGPCDRLLDATSGRTSYTLAGATTRTLTLTPTLSGDYKVTLTVVTTGGETIVCTFVVHVAGPGLRVELCWATSGDDDLDLLLHRPGTATPWALAPPASGDVCNYMNCKPQVGEVRPMWGYPASPLATCGGAAGPWSAVGHCPNPRLDLDNTATAGKPENINVDVPAAGATYRVAAHFYRHGAGATEPARPMVNVYCRGRRVATYGAAPDPVTDFTSNATPSFGALWRVADITTDGDGDCAVTALHPSGQTTGYRVTSGDVTY